MSASAAILRSIPPKRLERPQAGGTSSNRSYSKPTECNDDLEIDEAEPRASEKKSPISAEDTDRAGSKNQRSRKDLGRG